MGWAEKRIQAYARGEKASWLEKKTLEHAHPVNLIAHILATVSGIYGLWMHNWTWIIVAVVLGLIGHLYVCLKK